MLARVGTNRTETQIGRGRKTPQDSAGARSGPNGSMYKCVCGEWCLAILVMLGVQSAPGGALLGTLGLPALSVDLGAGLLLGRGKRALPAGQKGRPVDIAADAAGRPPVARGGGRRFVRPAVPYLAKQGCR